MWFKSKTARIVFSLSIAVFFLAATASFGKNYPLNKTVREISLRLVQIRRLSRTRQMDYKLVFCRERYYIDYLDKEKGRWQSYLQLRYRDGVLSEWDGIELIFSNGSFKDYRLKDQEGKIFDYVIMNFYRPGSTKKKAIIFYRKGDWKVLL